MNEVATSIAKEIGSRWKPYPVYKDSGIEWLGEIPEHWDVIQSRRVFKVRNEPSLESDEQLTASQKYGMLPQTEFMELERRRVVVTIKGVESLRHVEPNDFVISLRSFQGGIEWCKLRGSVTFHYIVLKPVKTLHPPYFGYLFKSSVFIQALRTTVDFIRDGQDLRYSHFVLVPLPVVPMDEQHTIASFLDRETTQIDTLITKKERLIELLTEKRSALISHAVTKGLDPTVPMKDSGVEWIGEIPTHWDVKRLGMAIQKLTNGYVGPTRDILVDEGIRYLQSLHIKGGQIRFEKPYYVTQEWSQDHAKSILKEDDVLLVQTGDIGQCCAVPKAFEDCNCHALIITRLKPGLGSGRYLSAFLRSDYGRNTLLQAQTGALHPHLECGKVREISILLPPPNEQDQIVNYIDHETFKMDALITKVHTHIEKLKEYRTALISAAVTGKIDVREEVA